MGGKVWWGKYGGESMAGKVWFVKYGRGSLVEDVR